MKKVVRMLGLCALVALAFTACKKNDTQKVSFTGDAAQPTSDVRTHISDGTFLVWSENDQIKVFNEAGDENMVFTAESSSGKPGRANFTADDPDEIAFIGDLTANYIAFYPNATLNENDKVVMVIPAEQEYYNGKEIGNSLYPMVGFNNGTSNFQFESNAGFLNVRFQVSNDSEVDTYTIDKIVLRSKDITDKLTGNFVYEKDGLSYVFDGTGNVVTLSGDPIDIIKGSAKDFTFVLPEGTLWSGFDVELYLGDQPVETFSATAASNVIEAQTFRAMPTGWLPRPTPVNP